MAALLPTQVDQMIDHLFRHQSGKMVAVLTRIFGTENLDLAEDVVQDSLLEAINTWTYRGIPNDPSAWLFKVAKNKALNIINREKYKRKYSSGLDHLFYSEWTAAPALNHLFSEQEILDDQLGMIFTCCHPSISKDSQVALALKTLCGFSIPEIARAFITTEENINKRLVRARQKIRDAHIPFEVPSGMELEKRLLAVAETTFLLFNEGYSASKGTALIRYKLCEEAIRLAEITVAHPQILNKSVMHALLALMYLNASRFGARQDNEGSIVQLDKQDRTKWSIELMAKGFIYLEKATGGNNITCYHILAAISACHCSAPDFEATDWQTILSLYNSLSQLDSSPLVLLNRSVAVSKVYGAFAALDELQKIEENVSLKKYHLFYSTQAEFYIQLKQYNMAMNCLEQAMSLSPLKQEKELLQKKMEFCSSQLK